jgi:UDP-GlcNAc3NAcA epimerase
MKVLSVVGARPQFVKAAVVERAMRTRPGIDPILLHTGQHFDDNMSDVFFRELDIPRPAHNLGIGGGTHGQNTGRMLEGIESVIISEQPEWVIVYGDTDSTVAGALAAVKQHVRVAHVEAGLRSFNRHMPEEINRVLTDHASSLLLAPTPLAVRNLEHEGLSGRRVSLVGDVMYDAALYYARKAESRPTLRDLGVERGRYVLATIHRPSNTDDRDQLRGILAALGRSRCPVVWPVHPRTRARIASFGLTVPRNVIARDPVGYLDMVTLERNAAVIVTDSGGVQKEAFFYHVPCLTVRAETEWIELLELGVNRLLGSDFEMLGELLSVEPPSFPDVRGQNPYGSGDAGDRVVTALRSAGTDL